MKEKTYEMAKRVRDKYTSKYTKTSEEIKEYITESPIMELVYATFDDLVDVKKLDMLTKVAMVTINPSMLLKLPVNQITEQLTLFALSLASSSTRSKILKSKKIKKTAAISELMNYLNGELLDIRSKKVIDIITIISDECSDEMGCRGYYECVLDTDEYHPTLRLVDPESRTLTLSAFAICINPQNILFVNDNIYCQELYTLAVARCKPLISYVPKEYMSHEIIMMALCYDIDLMEYAPYDYIDDIEALQLIAGMEEGCRPFAENVTPSLIDKMIKVDYDLIIDMCDCDITENSLKHLIWRGIENNLLYYISDFIDNNHCMNLDKDLKALIKIIDGCMYYYDVPLDPDTVDTVDISEFGVIKEKSLELIANAKTLFEEAFNLDLYNMWVKFVNENVIAECDKRTTVKNS